MATAQELVEQGIRAYVEGRLADARRLLEEALQVDPANSRARSYLLLLPGQPGPSGPVRPSRVMAAAGSPGPRSTPVPFPAATASQLPFVTPRPTPIPVAPPPAAPAPAPVPVPGTPRGTEREMVAAMVLGEPAPGAMAGQPIDVPMEITGERSLEVPLETAVESPFDLPLEAASQGPVGLPLGTGSANPFDLPPEAASGHPFDFSLEATGEAPVDVPVEITGEHPIEPLSQPSEPIPGGAPPQADYAPSPWDDGPASGPAIILGSEGGLDLDAVAEKSDLRVLVPRAGRPSTPQEDVEVWMTAAKDLLALGDFSGSLEMIEKILKLDPEHAEARDYLSQNESTLVAMYESKLGPLGRVPRLAIKPEEIMWLNLDHRAGFLLSQIDGSVDYESLFALSGLPRLDTARILAGLLADDVITA